MKRYITRSLEPVLKQAVREFPVVVLTGPRQSGKTTLARQVLAASDTAFQYASADEPTLRGRQCDYAINGIMMGTHTLSMAHAGPLVLSDLL